jgi:hypothetical protein
MAWLLRKAGITTTIILYDRNRDRPDYPLGSLADQRASQFVAASGSRLSAAAPSTR